MMCPPPENSTKTALTAAFTLIELSVVLVVIGLIVGGVLVGQDLIKAAAIRATVTQLEQFNTAVNTFYNKYGALPGDMNASFATSLGFTPRGNNGFYAGMGDGNGLIEGTSNASCNTCNTDTHQDGEPFLFWNDLTWANGTNVNLIPGSFSAATSASIWPPSIAPPAIDAWLPPARIGQGNYVYAWSINGLNYFGLSAVYTLNDYIYSSAGLTVSQAYAIDTKVDDGLPQSGRVIAQYLTVAPYWAQGGVDNMGFSAPAPGAAAGASSTSCYDNGGNASNPTQYSTEISGGTGVNCALSFQMQGAAR